MFIVIIVISPSGHCLLFLVYHQNFGINLSIPSKKIFNAVWNIDKISPPRLLFPLSLVAVLSCLGMCVI